MLYHIFLHAPPSDVECTTSLIDITTIEPMNFSMVCHSWRKAVLSHPNLWGRIHIKGNSEVPMRASFYRLLSKWFEYSQASPLNIRLYLWHDGNKEDAVIVNRDIIDTTADQHTRLQNIIISIGNSSTKRPFTLPFSPSFISLFLTLYPSLEPPEPLFDTKFGAYLDFTSAAASTNLRELCVSDRVRWSLPKHPRHTLHFPNLTDLDICTDLTGDVDDFYAVLVACPNVVDMTVYARRCVQSSASSTSAHVSSISEAVLLLHLKNLRIYSVNRSATTQLLRWLLCPSLRELTVQAASYIIDTTNFDDHCITPALLITYQEFFIRSKAPLSSLNLYYPSTPSSYDGLGCTLRNILRPLQTLEKLSLFGVVVDNDLFKEMTIHDGDRSGDSAICPFLTHFDLYTTDSSLGVQPGAVEEMIRSRRKTSAPLLKSFDIQIPGFHHRIPGLQLEFGDSGEE